jgi:hypothetical protein
MTGKLEALANGPCPNHGGLSSGPKTAEGRARIAARQRERWQAWRLTRTSSGSAAHGEQTAQADAFGDELFL